MLARRVLSVVKAFKAPKTSLGDLDAEAAATLIEASSDVALIVDAGGVIRDMAIHSDDLATEMAGCDTWLGQPWLNTVATDSRAKVEALLRDAGTSDQPMWRHINHPSARGGSVPILYCGVQVGDDGRVVVFGRDLRALSALQQRLVDAQQSMERDYARLRHVETRYRLLFEMSSEAVLVLDAATQKVADANPAARQLFGDAAKGVLGRPFLDIFDADSAPTVQGLLSLVRTAGRGDDVRARLADGGAGAAAGREVTVSASLFRQEAASLLLVRLPAVNTVPALVNDEPKIKTKLLQVVESAPDGFVVTNIDGRILTANAAFLDMAQLPSEEQARGEPLERWLGRPGVDLDVLIANLRQRGTIRLFATTLRGEFGETSEVEISGVSVVNGGLPVLGFAIRNIDRRLSPAAATVREMPRSVEQLTELIGRVSLKDLVREATDMIERLCIESALELTGDNRASAAEMLGLSRQSLYVKLRRYGLGDLAEETRN
jgi:transcriptional regulator PpsR